MAGFTQYLQKKQLDHVLKTASFTQPTNIYVGLYSAAPSDTGGGTELSGNAYARVLCNAWNAATSASPSVADNTAAITFPTATPSGWSQATHFGVFDDPSAGNLLGWAALTTPKTAGAGDTLRFAAGELDITLD
jgi:hypothetical protein